MINRIIEFSMKNRWLILAVYAALAHGATGRFCIRPSTPFPT
jgi:Cu/Ag efflux pump CusA